MLVAFLIMLREGLEAALIIGIMAGYTARRGNAAALPSIWAGVLAAIAASVAGGFVLVRTGQEFPQRAQEGFEAAVALIAMVLLLSMVLWMRRAGAGLKRDIEHSLDQGLAGASGRWSWALFLSAFLIVGREGLESVMFLVAILQQATGPGLMIGALSGLAVAVAIGFAIFRLGLKVNLGRFFRITGVFVIFVAAGLGASVLRKLHEAGQWNHLQGTAFDLSGVLPTDGILGTMLSGIFGYTATPSWGEVIVYLAVLLGALWAFFRPLPTLAPPPQRAAPTT
jgi:high-affinity iron transporter